MHRHREVLPLVCKYSHTRAAATSTKLQPRNWEVPSPSALSPTPASSSRWTIGNTNHTQDESSSHHRDTTSQSTGAYSSQPQAPSSSKWSLSLPHSLSSPDALSSRIPPANFAGQSTPNKWKLPNSLPPNSSFTGKSGTPSLDKWAIPSSKPQVVASPASPSSPSMNKWQISRTTPSGNAQPSHHSKGVTSSPYYQPSSDILSTSTTTSSSQTPRRPNNALGRWDRTLSPVAAEQDQRVHIPQLNFRSPPKHHNDGRLQRDMAPHQSLPQGQVSHRGSTSTSSGVRNGGPDLRPQGTRRTMDVWQQHDSPSRPPLRPISEERRRDSAMYAPPISTPVEQVRGSRDRDGRGHRDALKKGRGSLLDRLHEDPTISSKDRQLPRRQVAAKPRVPRRRKFVEKYVSRDVYIPSTVSVGTLARLLNVKLEDLQRKMRRVGMETEAAYDHVLTSDYAVLIAEEYGQNPIVNDEAAFDIHPSPIPANSDTLPSRPPVVTIMGHVDHGKTTLLDTLRSASVAKGEAGGITQHIGAFSVPITSSSADGPKSITFLDTPGHAAFSAMRARGAGVTDIVVLVVAADDGIMPQTKEVIELIKKDTGNVGVLVAINKVDKPGIKVDDVMKALMAEGMQLEAYGGDIPSVEVSGLTGQGLPDLVETLSAMAEVQDLRAEQDGPVHGHVLESKIQKGFGPVASILVLRGCLQCGSHIISGVSHAKVRVMNDSSGADVQFAYPGMAVTVSGWKTLPNAGDEVLQGTEAEIKKAIANRQRRAEAEATLSDVEAINMSRRQEREQRELGDAPVIKVADTGPKELRLIVKADVSGSAEAVVGALEGIGNNQVITKIISSGVGNVSESDIMMAKAVGGMVVGFSVSVSRAIETLAAQNGVAIVKSTIIYRLMDDIKDRVIALLPVRIETKVTGEATVLQLFDINLKAKQIKKIAGCRVTNGLIDKSKFARVIRDGATIHEGTIETMRQLKKDVTELRKGSECGLSLAGFDDLREGDSIQMYEKIEKPGLL